MCDGHVLNKTRHFVTHVGAIWYVDVYDGILNGVMLAEIELESADQQIELPGWIGKEVTGDPNYRKVNLLAQRIAALGENGSARQMIGAVPTR
jgi:CYTH domain-containing protein